ncbi:Fc.00g028950.m01.CDS01 [Cosmosporella sp. VM-42]
MRVVSAAQPLGLCDRQCSNWPVQEQLPVVKFKHHVPEIKHCTQPQAYSTKAFGSPYCSETSPSTKLTYWHSARPEHYATMISDNDLYRLAIFLGSASMVLIVIYHFLEVNSVEEIKEIGSEKGASTPAKKQATGTK